jgi:hypothetical protein
MNTAKISIMVLGVVLFMFMIAPVASAQYNPDMLGGKWFKVKASWKGYYDTVADETTGTYSGGSGKIYVYVTYTGDSDPYYTLATCTPDDNGNYFKGQVDSMHLRWITGDSYQKQLWDFLGLWDLEGDSLSFSTLDYGSSPIPFLVMDVKLDTNGAFKSAQFKSMACIGYFSDHGNPAKVGIGSCSLSGKTVAESKVPQAVKDACGP